MGQDSKAADKRWREFAARHQMAEYTTGHGLLRGCMRDLTDGRLVVNERVEGVQFGFYFAAGSAPPDLLWVDDSFLGWCQMPPASAAAEAAYKALKKAGLLKTAADEARARPHRATPSNLTDCEANAVRFRHLAGAKRARDLCDPSSLQALPPTCRLEVTNGVFSAEFPRVIEPSEPLAAIMALLGRDLSETPLGNP